MNLLKLKLDNLAGLERDDFINDNGEKILQKFLVALMRGKPRKEAAAEVGCSQMEVMSIPGAKQAYKQCCEAIERAEEEKRLALMKYMLHSDFTKKDLLSVTKRSSWQAVKRDKAIKERLGMDLLQNFEQIQFVRGYERAMDSQAKPDFD